MKPFKHLLISPSFALIEVMKQKITSYFSLTVFYLLVISLARFKLDFNILWIWLGGLVGAVILKSDYLFQVFLVQPQLPISQEAKALWNKNQYKELLRTVYGRKSEITSLTFHTIFFQIIFYAFSFFILSSSGSFFGGALVLTILLYLLQRQFEEIRKNGSLSSGWFSKLNVSLDGSKQKIYLGVAIVVFLLFTTFIIR